MERVERLREKMQAVGIDAMVITHPLSRRYMSGIPAGDPQPGETPGWLVITSSSAHGLITSSNFGGAVKQAPHLTVESVEAPIAEKIAGRTAGLLREQGCRRIGFEKTAITYHWYVQLCEGLGNLGELIPQHNLVESLRQIKDGEELALISKAARITSEAFIQTMDRVGPGITERQLVWELETAMIKMGADRPAFETIVAAGPGAAVPHHHPGDRAINSGEMVIIDMGALYRGYAADMTRTICFGPADEKLRHQYELVKQALDRAVHDSVAGRRGSFVLRHVEEIMSASNLHRGFPAGIGHGIGLAVHEPPHLKADDMLLESDMVIAIEPAVYEDGWGGIRLEDTVRIGSAAAERLTAAPFRLEYGESRVW